MTHAELVQRAVTWLRGTMGCGVVFAEHTAGREHPDAIGWKWATWSIVVECKVSRADFFADRRKPSRASYEDRPGCWCYYLTPEGLIRPDELPPGWGLLHAHARRVTVVAKPLPADPIDDRTTSQMRDEIYRLYQEVRRYQLHGLTYPKLTVGRREVRAESRT